ncbi:MAG: polyketide cyclase / dehydrase and lipid transport [Mycobacteriales bacterium]
MPMVDLIDETFIVAPPDAVAAAVHDPALWRELWPDLELAVFEDRGVAGLRFTVCGALAGSNELWLEPWGDGVIVHYYCRADLTRRGSATEPVSGSPRALQRRGVRATQRHARAVKAGINALKDRLEADR